MWSSETNSKLRKLVQIQVPLEISRLINIILHSFALVNPVFRSGFKPVSVSRGLDNCRARDRTLIFKLIKNCTSHAIFLCFRTGFLLHKWTSNFAHLRLCKFVSNIWLGMIWFALKQKNGAANLSVSSWIIDCWLINNWSSFGLSLIDFFTHQRKYFIHSETKHPNHSAFVYSSPRNAFLLSRICLFCLLRPKED